MNQLPDTLVNKICVDAVILKRTSMDGKIYTITFKMGDYV